MCCNFQQMFDVDFTPKPRWGRHGPPGLINYPRNKVVTMGISRGPCAGLIARQIAAAHPTTLISRADMRISSKFNELEQYTNVIPSSAANYAL